MGVASSWPRQVLMREWVAGIIWDVAGWVGGAVMPRRTRHQRLEEALCSKWSLSRNVALVHRAYLNES